MLKSDLLSTKSEITHTTFAMTGNLNEPFSPLSPENSCVPSLSKKLIENEVKPSSSPNMFYVPDEEEKLDKNYEACTFNNILHQSSSYTTYSSVIGT